MFHTIKDSFKVPQEARMLAVWLACYGNVFSTEDRDVAWTTFVEHSISLERASSVGQTPHYLGSEMVVEAIRQVANLLQKGLIGPASSGCHFPILLAKKKDRKCRVCND